MRSHRDFGFTWRKLAATAWVVKFTQFAHFQIYHFGKIAMEQLEYQQKYAKITFPKDPWCWNIQTYIGIILNYILGVHVGKYSIHGSSGIGVPNQNVNCNQLHWMRLDLSTFEHLRAPLDPWVMMGDTKTPSDIPVWGLLLPQLPDGPKMDR